MAWLKALRQSAAQKLAQYRRESYLSMGSDVEKQDHLVASLSENMISLRKQFGNSSDLLNRELCLQGIRVQLLACEGLVSLQSLTEILSDPLNAYAAKSDGKTPEDLYRWLRQEVMLAPDQKEVYTYSQLFQFLMSGFAVLLIDGLGVGICFGLQGYNFRSISEPSAEVNVRGSREGFVEPIRINMTMIRRRIKSPKLKFELMTVGSQSRTDLCLVYMTDRISEDFLNQTRLRLQQLPMDVVLESAYIQPFLEKKPYSFFSGIGTTERPDTLCAKIAEGRLAILVDGTPFALILPFLFHENFQTVDDYTHRPAYTAFVRILKYISFYLTILLPGTYVAVGVHHPELLPHALLRKVMEAEASTPFPLMFEALLIQLIYELMREAGLRLPRPVGHAIGIVGALVIGDAAVSAGLIGTPMVLIVALTAISSFVVPSLYDSVTVLKFLFILAGGIFGLFGITLGVSALLLNLCSVTVGGVPTTAPATPFNPYSLRDMFLRAGWKFLGKYVFHIEDVPGSQMGDKRLDAAAEKKEDQP